MAKGRLDRDKWHVWDDGSGRFFYAERKLDGKEPERHYVSAHCLACAKTEILVTYGGKVDLRGHNGMCGVFLKIMATTVDEEEGNPDEL